MRRAWYTLLSLLIISLMGFSAAHILINSSKEAVTWQEETLFGDKKAVAGIQLKATNHMSHHLLWETVGTLGGKLKPQTKFTFSNNSIQGDSIITYKGMYLGVNTEFLADLAFNGEEILPDYAKEKYAELIDYCLTCYESVEIGSEKEFQLDISQYMDYYTLSGHIDFPNTAGLIFSEFATNKYHNYHYRTPDEFTQAINEFFRIPIIGETKLNFSINRRQNGGSFGTSYAGGAERDVFNPLFDAIYINDTCYLTFDAVADNGEVADTSLIPGGYGLYRLNVQSDGNGGIRYDNPVAEMVFPMDPSEEFTYLDKSDDEKHIYIHTWQGSKLMRTILDAETMEVLQKFALVDQPEGFYREIKQYDNFLAVMQFSINNAESEKNTVTVFAEDEQGLYNHAFTVPMSPENLDVNDDLLIFSSVTAQLFYDGEKLYVVQNEFQSDRDAYAYSYGENCNFTVLAYEPDGISYIGKYHVNLSQINQDDAYDNGTVKPWYDAPVTFMKP